MMEVKYSANISADFDIRLLPIALLDSNRDARTCPMLAA